MTHCFFHQNVIQGRILTIYILFLSFSLRFFVAWYTRCHIFDILDQVICVIVLMAAFSDAILNLTPSARDPDCPPKFYLLT